jgi:GntR family transcriptional regulator/MocR family aminotransferase
MPPPLKTLDQHDRVLHFGTFWQLLYPLTTLGYLVVPKKLMAVLGKAKMQTEGITETFPQLALADMLDTGYLQKHARKVESIFAPKRRTLIYELKRTFGQRVSIEQQSGGITCLVTFRDLQMKQLVFAAKTAGLPLVSTAPLYVGAAPEGECVIYFPGLGTEAEIKTTLQKFARALTLAV